MLRSRLLINSSSRVTNSIVGKSHNFRVFLDDSIDSGKDDIRIGLKKHLFLIHYTHLQHSITEFIILLI